MNKLQQNSPMPLKVPKKKGKGDEGTETARKGSSFVGQPELNGKNNSLKDAGEQLNERKNGPQDYTD